MNYLEKPLMAIVFISLIFLSVGAYATDAEYPEVGKPMVGFRLKTRSISGDQFITPASLQGKNYILDFWSTGCGACVAAFPKMDSLQDKFAPKLRVILVGLEEKNRDVRKFYDVYKKKDNLSLTSIFDSVSFEKLVPSGVPHLIWVGSDGIVKAITTTVEVNEQNISKFLDGKPFPFEDVSYKAMTRSRQGFSTAKPFLIDGNGGSDTSYAFRSVIAIWNPEMGSPSFPQPYPEKINGRAQYQIISAPVDVLYELAHFGTTAVEYRYQNTYALPVFSDEAQEIFTRRFGNGKRFSYSLEMPIDVSSPEAIMEKLRGDLRAFFGLKSAVVEKEMPCLKLVVIDEKKFEKIKSSSGKKFSSWAAESPVQTFTNIPIDQVMETLRSKILPYSYKYFSNETGYNSRLTFEIKAAVYSLESIRAGLRAVGLDIVESTNKLHVLEVTEDHP